MTEAAVTTLAPIYPGFVNFTLAEDGTVRVSVRGEATEHPGVHVCGIAEDAGKPGRCTPGGEGCNNYCNMAPQLGPMADKPNPFTHTREGARAELVLSRDLFEGLICEGAKLIGGEVYRKFGADPA